MLGRIKKIVIPYIISFFVYFLYFLNKDWIDLKYIAEYFLLGTLVAHFYYIIIALQSYLIFPIIQRMFIKYDKLLLIFSLICTIIFQAFISFKYSDRFIGAYIFYFVFGMFLAKYMKKTNLNKILKQYIIPFGIIAFLHIYFSYMSNIGKLQYSGSALINIVYVTLAIMIIFAICTLITKKSRKLNGLVEVIDENSYYIYLYHILIMHLLQNEILSYFNLSIRYRFMISVIFVYLIIIISCIIKRKMNIK